MTNMSPQMRSSIVFLNHPLSPKLGRHRSVLCEMPGWQIVNLCECFASGGACERSWDIRYWLGRDEHKNVAVTGRCLESSTRDMVTRFSLLIWFGRIFARKRQRNLNGSKQTNVAKGWWVFCFMCWFLTQEDAGCSALSVKKHGCGRCAYPVKFSWLARLFATVNSIGLLLMHFKCMKVPKYQWYALQFE